MSSLYLFSEPVITIEHPTHVILHYMMDKVMPGILNKFGNKVPKRVVSKWLDIFIPEYKKQLLEYKRFPKLQVTWYKKQPIGDPFTLLREGAERFIEILSAWAEVGPVGEGLGDLEPADQGRTLPAFPPLPLPSFTDPRHVGFELVGVGFITRRNAIELTENQVAATAEDISSNLHHIFRNFISKYEAAHVFEENPIPLSPEDFAEHRQSWGPIENAHGNLMLGPDGQDPVLATSAVQGFSKLYLFNPQEAINVQAALIEEYPDLSVPPDFSMTNFVAEKFPLGTHFAHGAYVTKRWLRTKGFNLILPNLSDGPIIPMIAWSDLATIFPEGPPAVSPGYRKVPLIYLRRLVGALRGEIPRGAAPHGFNFEDWLRKTFLRGYRFPPGYKIHKKWLEVIDTKDTIGRIGTILTFPGMGSVPINGETVLLLIDRNVRELYTGMWWEFMVRTCRQGPTFHWMLWMMRETGIPEKGNSSSVQLDCSGWRCCTTD